MTLSKTLRAVLIASLLALLSPPNAHAESDTEEKFQELFVTAGYATAFGAAVGAASLSFYDNPDEHLRIIAVGASLGFIGGSILGTYLTLAPVVAESSTNPRTQWRLANATARPNELEWNLAPLLHRDLGMTAQFRWNIP